MKTSVLKKGIAVAAAAVLAFALTCGIAGCNKDTEPAPEPTPTPEPAPAPEPTSYTITDMSGYELTLTEVPHKMLMNWPGGLAVLLMFGQDDNMAAYMGTVGKASYTWMQRVAPSILTKPVADDLTAEAALQLGADLVIVRTADEAEPYRNAGLPAIAMQQSNMDQLRQVITIFGELFGMEDHAEAYLKYLDDTLAFIAERLKDVPEADYPVIYTINAGRGKTPTITDAGNTVSTVYFKLAGGTNATATLDLKGYGAEISVEQLLQINPDIIVVNGGSSQQVYKDLLADTTLNKLSAVTSGQTYIVPMGVHTWSGTGPECILYIQWLAKTIYPEKFADVDMHQVIKDFYSQFYFTDFTDEEVDAMMAGFPSLDAYKAAQVPNAA